MRAIEIAEKNGPLTLVDRPVPEPKRGEVRVRIEACGICHSGSLAVQGLHSGTTYPLILGHKIVDPHADLALPRSGNGHILQAKHVGPLTWKSWRLLISTTIQPIIDRKT